MAAVTRQVTSAMDGRSSLSITFDSVTNAISSVSWVSTPGARGHFTIKQAGKADIGPVNYTPGTGSQNVPAGYVWGSATFAEEWGP